MENKITKIQVLGSGCSTCEKLFNLTKQVVGEIDLQVEVDYITDIQKILQMGIISSPILTINDKPVIVGIIPSIEKIKKIIQDNN